MQITSIEIENFKRVKKAKVQLADINILVGGNNSGKSSVLQGIHFSVVAAVASRRLDKKTFAQDYLLYCPAKSFVDLRSGYGYQNQSNFGYMRVRGTNIGNDDLYAVRVYRARNEGNVGCDRAGDPSIGTMVTSSIPPFSIYVPGLAGIPQVEEFRSESVIRKGVASGDANLYLRNVLLLIKKKKQLTELTKLMTEIFPKFSISVDFDAVNDSHIKVSVGLRQNEQKRPLELVGTGVLQALQIFSYATLFKPRILLLDEPDAHLHPDNQALLSQALQTVTEELDTKIIVATHSRHLVDALYGEANFIWMKEGLVHDQGLDLHKVSVLMDLGALDSFDKLLQGEVDYVFLSEDTKLDLLKTLVKASGFDLKHTRFYSYKASSNIGSAGALAEFIKEHAPTTKVVIHADNDFLTHEEQEKLEDRIETYGAEPFITEGPDLEHYFVNIGHLSSILDEPSEEISNWLDELATDKHNKLTHKFSRKRDDAKRKLYKPGETTPDTLQLMGDQVPLPPEKRHGKFMFKLIRGAMQERFGKSVDLIQDTDALTSARLSDLLS